MRLVVRSRWGRSPSTAHVAVRGTPSIACPPRCVSVAGHATEPVTLRQPPRQSPTAMRRTRRAYAGGDDTSLRPATQMPCARQRLRRRTHTLRDVRPPRYNPQAPHARTTAIRPRAPHARTTAVRSRASRTWPGDGVPRNTVPRSANLAPRRRTAQHGPALREPGPATTYRPTDPALPEPGPATACRPTDPALRGPGPATAWRPTDPALRGPGPATAYRATRSRAPRTWPRDGVPPNRSRAPRVRTSTASTCLRRARPPPPPTATEQPTAGGKRKGRVAEPIGHPP